MIMVYWISDYLIESGENLKELYYYYKIKKIE